MRQTFKHLWHGLTETLSGIANWFTVALGMKDDSRYGRFIRRVVGTCFAVIMVVIAVAFVFQLAVTISGKLGIERDVASTNEFGDQYISRNISFYRDDYGQNGYVIDRFGKKTLKHVAWISKPLGYDSLVCYSNGKKRGYFNMFTGKTAIEPTYNHAWIFSEGLAAVEDGGIIKFIDQEGKVVIDKQLPFFNGADGYVFHDGYCIVHNDRRDLFGLIDHKGNWVLQPKYFSIENYDSLWIVSDGKQEAVLDSKMHEVLPFANTNYEFSSEGFLATMPDHTLRKYNKQGELVDDFCISSFETLTYEIGNQHSAITHKEENKGGDAVDSENGNKTQTKAKASCMRYEAESGWFGLMSQSGKVITPPSYTDIIAIAADTYLCKGASGYGIILNGKGEKVK